MKTANFTVEGDLNINLLDVTNKNVEEYAIVMASQGLKSLLNAPTRVKNNS